jgi:SNF2 family DNA or RNA helicase
MIHISHLTRSLVVPFRDDIFTLFPHSKRFIWEKQDMLALPHGIDETIMLRNLNIHVPAPIIEHYAFPSADFKRPFDKQVLTAASMVMNTRSYVLNSMGTGKTKACIWAFDYLRSIKRAQRMLVVAPLSTLNFTWAREIFNTFPQARVKVLTGTRERRLKLLKEDADIYIVNHDGIKVIFDELQKRRDIDVICFDEVAAYRNYRAERSKIARKLAERRSYIWGMTGSPTPSSPVDAYGLAHLINPYTAPRSWMNFRTETMMQVSQFKWVARQDAADTVARLLQPAVRYTLDDITELPPLIIRNVEVEIGVRQKQVYQQMKDHASVMMKEGTITAANGGIVFSKMLQASLGWVYDNDGKTVVLDNQNRIDALMDLIESAERKVIVFSPFKSATAGISAALKKEGIDFAEVTGDTPHGKRTEIFNAFQGTSKYRVLNAHPECMSHGLTLTAADTIIWFGPVTKLETYEQANARITRVGQAHKQQVIRMIGTPAERLLYQRLAAKEDLQHNVLNLLAEITGDKR